MKLINLNAISLSTGKELLSIPLDCVDDDLEKVGNSKHIQMVHLNL